MAWPEVIYLEVKVSTNLPPISGLLYRGQRLPDAVVQRSGNQLSMLEFGIVE